MIGPKEKKERSLGIRLYLKGDRCASPKCAMVRKPYKPGAHGQDRSRGRKSVSEFGLQTKEKQKFKLTYGIDECNLRNIFEKASKTKGISTDKILELLERRLDNIVFRFGIASSRGMARQFVVHGHIFVNGKKTRSPGYLIKEGDVISISPSSEKKDVIKKRTEAVKKKEMQPWFFLDKEKLEGKIISLPQNVETPFDINLLIDAFSK